MKLVLEIVQIIDTLFFIVLLVVNHVVVGNDIFLLLSGKTFLGLSVLVKIDLNLLFLRIIGYFRSFLVKISAFYNAYSLKLKTNPQDE